MRCFLYIIIFIFTLSIWAQQTEKQTYGAYSTIKTKPQDSLFSQLKKASNFEDRYKVYTHLINYHRTVGLIDSIIHYGYRINQEASETNLKNKIYYQAIGASLIAEGNNKIGLYDNALKWYLTGLKLAKDSKNDSLIKLNQIGVFKSKFNRGAEAEGIALLETYSKTLQPSKAKYDALFALGKMYLITDDITKAKLNFNETLAYYTEKAYKKDIYKAQLNLGIIASKEGKKQQALELLHNIYNNALKFHFYDLYIKSGNAIGKIYLEAEEYKLAAIILNTVIANTWQWHQKADELDAVNSLRELESRQGNYKNAYALLINLYNLNEELKNQQSNSKVNQLEIAYETQLKEDEIERQRSIKNYVLIGFLVVLIPLLGLFYVYYQKLQTQSKLNQTLEKFNQQKVTALLKDQELKLIKASVEGEERERKRIAQELHDSIGGNLASIKLQLSSKNQQNITKQIDDTYHLVRDLSHNLMPKQFTDRTFTILIHEYIMSINEASSEIIHLHMHPEAEINALDNAIKIEIYKIVQELMTNALKHAKSSNINIHITKLENEIALLFEDDGVGFKTYKIKEGMGFRNIKERLKAINGSMHIDAFPNRGTVVSITINLKP